MYNAIRIVEIYTGNATRYLKGIESKVGEAYIQGYTSAMRIFEEIAKREDNLYDLVNAISGLHSVALEFMQKAHATKNKSAVFIEDLAGRTVYESYWYYDGFTDAYGYVFNSFIARYEEEIEE